MSLYKVNSDARYHSYTVTHSLDKYSKVNIKSCHCVRVTRRIQCTMFKHIQDMKSIQYWLLLMFIANSPHNTEQIDDKCKTKNMNYTDDWVGVAQSLKQCQKLTSDEELGTYCLTNSWSFHEKTTEFMQQWWWICYSFWVTP